MAVAFAGLFPRIGSQPFAQSVTKRHDGSGMLRQFDFKAMDPGVPLAELVNKLVVLCRNSRIVVSNRAV